MATSSNSASESDIPLQLEMDIEEDVPAELEHFVRLVMLGEDDAALEYFDRVLTRHLHAFPVFAEYIDLVLPSRIKIGSIARAKSLRLRRALDDVQSNSFTSLQQEYVALIALCSDFMHAPKASIELQDHAVQLLRGGFKSLNLFKSEQFRVTSATPPVAIRIAQLCSLANYSSHPELLPFDDGRFYSDLLEHGHLWEAQKLYMRRWSNDRERHPLFEKAAHECLNQDLAGFAILAAANTHIAYLLGKESISAVEILGLVVPEQNTSLGLLHRVLNGHSQGKRFREWTENTRNIGSKAAEVARQTRGKEAVRLHQHMQNLLAELELFQKSHLAPDLSEAQGGTAHSTTSLVEVTTVSEQILGCTKTILSYHQKWPKSTSPVFDLRRDIAGRAVDNLVFSSEETNAEELDDHRRNIPEVAAAYGRERGEDSSSEREGNAAYSQGVGGASSVADLPDRSRSDAGFLAKVGSLQSYASRRTSRRSAHLGSTSKSVASAFLSSFGKGGDNKLPSPANVDDEGQNVGEDYVLGKIIGIGTDSVVREAYTVGPEEIFAVKIVRKKIRHLSDAENKQLEVQLEREVEIWRLLRHQHILELIAVYLLDEATFCFMPLMSGGTLHDVLRSYKSGLPIDTAMTYARQIAAGLEYLHDDAQIVHGDLNLQHCWLSGEAGHGRIKLSGFQRAHKTYAQDERLTPMNLFTKEDEPNLRALEGFKTASRLRNMEYIAPELFKLHARRQHEEPSGWVVDGRDASEPLQQTTAMDIWAFGVCFYALVTGKMPFHHTSGGPAASIFLAGDLEFAILDLKGASEVAECIEACLKLDPKERWDIDDVGQFLTE